MGKRPAGISIIAWIYILISGISLVSSLILSVYSWPLIIIYLTIFISAVALYLGQKWAWWLMATLAMFMLIRNTSALILAIGNSSDVTGIGQYYLLTGGKLIFHCLILIVLLSKPAIQFFAFQKLNTVQRLLILFAVCVAIFSVF